MAGAPKGNKNALKHGLYARRVHNNEKKRIGNLPVKDVEGEIAYLRTVAARIALILEKNGYHYMATDLPEKETYTLLFALNDTMGKILSYVRAHALLHGELDDWEKEIEEGRRLARLDMKVYDYFTYPLDPETE